MEIKLRVTSANRSYQEQNDLYAKGRTTSGNIVTNARGGESFHNFGLAIDVVEIKDGAAIWNNTRWGEISNLAKSIGFEWGGDFNSFVDKPHFQYSYGYTLAELRGLKAVQNVNGNEIKLLA